MLGIFTASDSGIGTAQDYSTGNTATQVKCDNLIGAQEQLRSGYQRNASWLFSPTAMRQIRTLKDGEGQYLFQPSIKAGSSDVLLGKPIYRSPYVPDTFTTGLYVGAYGDWSYYWMAIDLKWQVQVVDQLYAEQNITEIICRAEIDGMMGISEAAIRVTLG